MTNYTSNALNHLDGEKEIEIRVLTEENHVKVTVFNTGTPIPEEDIPNLWNKFYKVDKARTREYGGSGIGLSIVKAIMEGLHQQYGVQNYDNGVDLTDEARAVPYTVTNTTYNITSTAFIQVPAYGVFPPTLRPKAPALKVNARETITINIADYVRVGAGKTAYVDGADSVSATKAADGDLYVNDQTLKFTASKDYSGPASITFTAVDGKRDKNDKVKIINSAVLTLPITVIGRDVPAPTFSSPTIDVVAGESATTIDLTALTHSASDLYDDEKQYTNRDARTHRALRILNRNRHAHRCSRRSGLVGGHGQLAVRTHFGAHHRSDRVDPFGVRPVRR